MARLTFSNVPTSTGGVISGNISIGAGSPFGAGGKYEAQVADIQTTIASAPEGFYDPVGWDDFLRKEELYSEELPEGFRIYGIEDPEVLDALLDNQQAQRAVQELAIIRKRYLGYEDRIENPSILRANALIDTGFGLVAGDKLEARINYLKEYIALSFDQVLKEKNAPIIQAIEQRERQLEIDQAVKLALEQKIRETATPKPTPTPEPTPTTPVSTISILPIIIIAVALIGILLFLRRRA